MFFKVKIVKLHAREDGREFKDEEKLNIICVTNQGLYAQHTPKISQKITYKCYTSKESVFLRKLANLDEL